MAPIVLLVIGLGVLMYTMKRLHSKKEDIEAELIFIACLMIFLSGFMQVIK
ncbi:MAG: hypothetical protein AAB598_02015 [Patescibacteria group bacterium]